MSSDKRLVNVEEKLDKLLTNDIPHLNERLGKIETNLSWLTKLTTIVLVAVIASLVEVFLTK